MLDLFISYINFLILSISFIVKQFVFLPPDPPKYLIVKEKINKGGKIKEKEEILFLMKSENGNTFNYKKLTTKFLNVKYSKIIGNNYSLPILIITPKFYQQICIIYCQGNSGDLGTSLFECFMISIKCYSIIITFEYPGYGICKNEEIKESEFYKRIKIVYNYVINVLNFKPNQIILYGFSLGSGIAFDFACKKEFPVAGLILQSPFLSIIRTIYDIKTTKYFDLFNNCDKAKNLCTKTLFIHGNNDTIVPYKHGRILSDIIPQQYFYDFITVDKADHNNLIKNTKEWIFQYINEFISFCTDDNSSYYNNEIIENTDINEEKKRKRSDLSSLTKSEDFIMTKSKEIEKPIISLENGQNLEKQLKPHSYINDPIKYKINLTIDNNNQNLKFNLQCEKEKINLRYLDNAKPKIENSSKNYYYVNIGTFSQNNKFPIYNNYYCQSHNNKNIKNLIKENSMSSIFSSNVTINNSN